MANVRDRTKAFAPIGRSGTILRNFAWALAGLGLAGCARIESPRSSRAALDTFPTDVDALRNEVAGWEHGTGLAVRWMTTAGDHSLIYVDATPPQFKSGLDMWLIQSGTTMDGELFSTLVLTVPELRAGRWEGQAGSKADCILAGNYRESTWNPDAPTSAFSTNGDGWCELELKKGELPGDLVGRFSGKLVANDGAFSLTVRDGYLYINR